MKKTDKSPEFQVGIVLFNVIIPSNSFYFVHVIVSRLKTCITVILVSSLLFTLFPFHSFQEISTHHKGTTENAPEETMHKKQKVTAKRLLSCTVENVNCTS